MGSPGQPEKEAPPSPVPWLSWNFLVAEEHLCKLWSAVKLAAYLQYVIWHCSRGNPSHRCPLRMLGASPYICASERGNQRSQAMAEILRSFCCGIRVLTVAGNYGIHGPGYGQGQEACTSL